MAEISVTIFQREDRPFWYMQYRDPVTDRKVRKCTGKKTRRDAERAAANWEKDLREGRFVINGRMGWAEFRSKYETAAGGLAPNTQKRIEGVLNVLERIIAPKTVGRLTRETLDTYAVKLRDDGRSESTIKSHLAHIRAALSWGVERGYLYSVPKMPKLQRAKTRKAMRGRPITISGNLRLSQAGLEQVLAMRDEFRSRTGVYFVMDDGAAGAPLNLLGDHGANAA